MSKEQIFEWFYRNSSLLSAQKIIGIFLMGLVVGGLVFITYKITYSGVAYNSRFNISNVVILLITIVLMLMISSNIVISMGMVGALSIVRFRTAIKDPRDIVFIFWSITEGLCIGSQNNKLAIISSAFISIILVISTYGVKISRKYLLIIRAENIVTEANIKEMLISKVVDCKMRNLHKNNGKIEMIYEVKLKKGMDESVLNQLLENTDITYLNWLVETGEMVG